MASTPRTSCATSSAPWEELLGQGEVEGAARLSASTSEGPEGWVEVGGAEEEEGREQWTLPSMGTTSRLCFPSPSWRQCRAHRSPSASLHSALAPHAKAPDTNQTLSPPPARHAKDRAWSAPLTAPPPTQPQHQSPCSPPPFLLPSHRSFLRVCVCVCVCLCVSAPLCVCVRVCCGVV